MFDSHWGVHLSKAPWPPTGSRAAAIAASRSSTAAALGCVSPRTARNTTSGELALSKRERRLSRATCSTLFCCAAAIPSRPRARSSGMWIVIVSPGTILSTPGALRQAVAGRWGLPPEHRRMIPVENKSHRKPVGQALPPNAAYFSVNPQLREGGGGPPRPPRPPGSPVACGSVLISASEKGVRGGPLGPGGPP